MKKTLIGFLLIFASVNWLASCAYNTKEDAPGPQNGCDTTIKFTYADIGPILTDQGCNSCHSPNGSRPSSDLSDASKVRSYINEHKESFIKSIKFEGDTPMPKGGPAMPDSLQNKIEAWICQGMN